VSETSYEFPAIDLPDGNVLRLTGFEGGPTHRLEISIDINYEDKTRPIPVPKNAVDELLMALNTVLFVAREAKVD
jgi:hypothetical protein